MGTQNLSIALLAAGICLAMGVISLFTGLHKNGEKTDTLFGIMCLSLFLFFVIPPQGFIIADKAPYPLMIIVKRIFNFGFSFLFPWFILSYTGFKKQMLPRLISGLWVVSYILMATSKEDSNRPLWVLFVLVPMGISLIHGFLAVRFQKQQGDKNKAVWLSAAMFVFLSLYVISGFYQIAYVFFRPFLGTKIFFPINLFPLAFVAIMGIRLRRHSLQKFEFEQTLGLKNLQWESLLNNIQMIAIHLDAEGQIKYVNPYGIRLLGYQEESELNGKDWFEFCLPGPEKKIIKDLFREQMAIAGRQPYYKNSIVTKSGEEKLINWTNELVQNADKKITGVFCFGSDITSQEKAFAEILKLNAELEKEALLLKGEPLPPWMQEEIIGSSQALSYVIQKAKKVAGTQASVLLEGETGVGKELFADLIQRSSLRSKKPFVKVNCGALPAELIEDELFGHEKGAFTGAAQIRKGRFEMANEGTIFLDEIGELPLALQPKLLRVLQSGEFERIGGQQTLKIDVRIIAATNRDLAKEVRESRFRDDLYYRLNVYPITVPALRNRKEDIPMLIHYFINREAKKAGKEFKNISKADLNKLSDYPWPGNVRELANVIERSVINSDNETLRLDMFLTSVSEGSETTVYSMEEIEREHITKVLNENNWRISGEGGAAEKLAMNPNTLRSRMKKLNISRKETSSSQGL